MSDEQPIWTGNHADHRILYLKELARGSDPGDLAAEIGALRSGNRSTFSADGLIEQGVPLGAAEEEGPREPVIENVELPTDVWLHVVKFIKNKRELLCLHRLCRNASHAATHRLIRSQGFVNEQENVTIVKVNGHVRYVRYEYH